LKKSMTVYARLHSYHSLLRAVVSPQELAGAVAKAGYQAAVLTDELSLSGAVSFYRTCRELAIQPILGISFSGRQHSHAWANARHLR
jgi:DNA polymerase-3 subunit alpha